MSVTLWLDTASEATVELGGTLPFYSDFAEVARAAGDGWPDAWPDLAGVAAQCETQEDADPEWLADVRSQAARFLREHGDKLSDRAHRLVVTLAHAGAP